jgi:hypothetical protein
MVVVPLAIALDVGRCRATVAVRARLDGPATARLAAAALQPAPALESLPVAFMQDHDSFGAHG